MAKGIKTDLKEFAKVLAIIIAGFVAIISNVSIWNATSAGILSAFQVWVSILNFVMEGMGLYFISSRFLFKKNKESKKEDAESPKL